MSEWQPIETHGGRYYVSNDGQIKRNDGRLLKQWKNDQGYRLVRLSRPRVVMRVHRLVAIAFIPNPKQYPFVNHIDCNRSNNTAENLEWCTQWQNLMHSELLGRMQRNYWSGKRSPNALLSDKQAATIREKYQRGGYSWESLGKEFGISKRSVGRIVNGETYV